MIERKDIEIVLNKHYKPDAVTVQCGERAFSNLPPELTQVMKQFDYDSNVDWYIQAQRRGETITNHLHFVNGELMLRKRKHPYGRFPSYLEARKVADKLKETGMFERILITEEHRQEGI